MTDLQRRATGAASRAISSSNARRMVSTYAWGWGKWVGMATVRFRADSGPSRHNSGTDWVVVVMVEATVAAGVKLARASRGGREWKGAWTMGCVDASDGCVVAAIVVGSVFRGIRGGGSDGGAGMGTSSYPVQRWRALFSKRWAPSRTSGSVSFAKGSGTRKADQARIGGLRGADLPRSSSFVFLDGEFKTGWGLVGYMSCIWTWTWARGGGLRGWGRPVDDASWDVSSKYPWCSRCYYCL